MFLSILESGRHKLLVAHGLTLVTPSLCGWEALSTPRGLTITRITWALSPMASQVPSVIPGSLLCPWCCRHSSWRGVRQPMCHVGWLAIKLNLNRGKNYDSSIQKPICLFTLVHFARATQHKWEILLEKFPTFTEVYSHLGKITLIWTWFTMVLTQIITWIYKEFFSLRSIHQILIFTSITILRHMGRSFDTIKLISLSKYGLNPSPNLQHLKYYCKIL